MDVILILLNSVMRIFGFAGGGGSSSDFGGGGGGFSGGGFDSDWGSSSSSGGDGDFIVTVIILVIFVIVYFIMEKSNAKNRKKISMSNGERASMVGALDSVDYNSTKQEQWIHEEAKRIFIAYQTDWSKYDLKAIQEYTSDQYFAHASLMLEAIDKAGRRNVVSNLVVNKVNLLTEVNDGYELPMKVKVMFKFSGTDGVVDSKTGKKIYSDKASGAVEFWNFIYDGKSLKLESIGQSTQSSPHLVESIEKFAKDNRLFYSPDWGRLALPTKGIIFSEWSLSSADVNNHVVGRWNKCLIQMYTYSPRPAEANSYYIVGQINVPKSYKGVIIESKKAKLKVVKPEAYREFKMEWEEFNRRYHVYAASEDALPAFELLNPAFMEVLYEKSLPYNLEVADNVIYIFAKVSEAREEDYAELFGILSDAFSELRM